MATNYISLTGPGATPQATKLANTLVSNRANFAWLATEYQIMVNLVDNTQSPPSCAAIESRYGLQAGQGAQLLALFQAGFSILQNAAVVAIQTQVGP